MAGQDTFRNSVLATFVLENGGKKCSILSGLLGGCLWVIGPGDDVWRLAEGIRKMGRDISVVNVADDYVEPSHHHDICYIHCGLNDGPEDWDAPWGAHNSCMAYRNAFLAMNFALSHFSVVFLHCHGGVSRSSMVAALVAKYVYGHGVDDFDEAVGWVKDRHKRCNIHPKHRAIEGEIFEYIDSRKLW